MSDMHGLLPRHEALVAERKRITESLGLPSDATADTIVDRIEDTKRRMAPVNQHPQSEIPTTFTPGPWEWTESIDGLSYQNVVAPTQNVIECVDEYRVSVSDEDATLIAKAPDLYALLAEFYDATWDAGDFSLPLTLRDRALAALKKARGEA